VVRQIGRMHFLRLGRNTFRGILEQFKNVRGQQRRQRAVMW
jgi:hypothetical protein